MGDLGFFTRQDAHEALAEPARFRQSSQLPMEYLHRLGLEGVKNLNPKAANPNMALTGSKHPLVYVLGEAPGADEDALGKQFVGASGKLLRSQFPRGSEDVIAYDNCCRTRPPGNRTPTPTEVECFRPSVVADIERLRPKIILGVGMVPLSWMFKGQSNITVCRGRRFPVRVGKHRCWFYSIFHPAYILRIQNARGEGSASIPGEEHRRVFDADIARVFKDLDNLPEPKSERLTTLESGIEIIAERHPDNLDKIRNFLRKVEEAGELSTTDLETRNLRPYRKDSAILTMAVGDGDNVLAFPVDHPRFAWSVKEREELHRIIRRYLLAKIPKQAFHAAFELEWFGHFFGRRVVRASRWLDPMAAGYVLDEREGALNLDFLTMQYLGLQLKAQSKVDRKHPEKSPLPELLRYNALDAKYTHRLGRVLRREVRRQKLREAHSLHIDRIPSFVLSQLAGLPVKVSRVERYQRRMGAEIKGIRKEIQELPDVKRFNRFYGSFNANSTNDMRKMFVNILKRGPECTRGNTFSTNEEILKPLARKVPLAGLVLKLRGVSKLKSTYVDVLHPDTKDTLVYPDGNLHPQFNTMLTRTGRTSCEDPNGQNWPKRKHKEVRSQIVAPKDWWMIASDYGQLEARVIAMASGDPYLIKALWEDYDIHLEWAEKIARAWPRTYKARGSNIKGFRSDIKNEWTFPAFYGAKLSHLCRMLDMPERVGAPLFEEFWDSFRGVRKWQRGLWTFYEENLFVECLTGRRRRAPMNHNMVLNSPIQGTASDIVVASMNSLSDMSMANELVYFQPRLNVHDDLTFMVPKSDLDYARKVIIREMTMKRFKWINVPLQIELSEGPDWFRLEETGRYRSN